MSAILTAVIHSEWSGPCFLGKVHNIHAVHSRTHASICRSRLDSTYNPTSLQDVLPSEAVEYIVCILCNSHCKCMWYGMDHVVLLMLHKHFNKETNTHATLLRIGVCIKYTQMYTVNSVLAFCITAIH